MAKLHIHVDNTHFVCFTKEEAVHVISLLTAQLANVSLSRHSNGACPDVYVNGTVRYSFVVEPDAKQ